MNPRFSKFFWQTLPRGLALFFGGFALLNVLGDLRRSGFDANLWWIDLRFLPQSIARVLLLAAALCLIAFAVRPPRSAWRRGLTLGAVGLLGIAGLENTAQFYILLARGTVSTGIPVPLSLFVTAALGLVFVAVAQASWPRRRLSFLPIGRFAPELHRNDQDPSARGAPGFLSVLAVCLGCLVLFPLAQMFCFGKTDYRRAADAAVVLGARVYADGRPSDALADRVRTACTLYRQGLAKKLIFSGGPGDGRIHETESMKRLAIRLGVKPEDIFLDEAGLNTQATVKNSESILEKLHASRVLVVSHFYHLPRIKLAFQRAGREVYTVPARESYLLRQMPFNIAREVAALWVYYLRPGGADLRSAS